MKTMREIQQLIYTRVAELESGPDLAVELLMNGIFGWFEMIAN